jgi:translation initiation factor IF-3
MFRGREMQHPELGRKILDQVAAAVTEVAKVEIYPRLDGRNMTMVLGPDKKAQAAADKKRQTPDAVTPEVAGAAEDVVESIPTEPIPAPAPEAAEQVAVDTESPEVAETPEA